MTSAAAPFSASGSTRALDLFAVLARWLLGVMFIYMGLNKALHPVDFLKLVRQYEIGRAHV